MSMPEIVAKELKKLQRENFKLKERTELLAKYIKDLQDTIKELMKGCSNG